MLDIPFEPTQDKSFSQKKSCIYLKIKCGKDFLGLSQRLNHYYSYIYIYIYMYNIQRPVGKSVIPLVAVYFTLLALQHLIQHIY